jgi:hypothetical protein
VTESTSCAVCGRTILKGERTRTYLTPDGEPHPVCELCRSRAEALHWVWVEDADRQPPIREARRRRMSLAAWLRGRAKQRQGEAEPAEQPASTPPPANGSAGQPAARGGSPDPAARGARVGRAGAVREPGTRLERAVARFNASEHARTVAGLTRTLGEPWVSVGAAAGSPNEIRLTVAWELSWYQWGVDIGEPERAVYEIDKGHEVSEIDAPAREWNARVEDGALQLGAGTAKRGAEPAPTGTTRANG